MGALRTIAYGETHVGKVRDHNEDAFIVDVPLGLFMVADGVGGGNAGEVASAMLTEFVHDEVSELWESLEERSLSTSEQRQKLKSFLPKLIERSSERIYRKSLEDRQHRGMATTAVLAKTLEEQALICHVGDSRLYLIRGKSIHQITQDHSLARELVEKGVLKQEEVPCFKYRNVILRSVGLQPTVQVDTLRLDLLPGDLLLLCSDGLSDMISTEKICSITRGASPRDAVKAMIAAANEAGGVDNITVILIQVLGKPPTGQIMATELKASFLKNLFLFKDLSFPETLKVMQCVHERHVSKGEQVLTQGMEGDCFFLLTDGGVEVLRDGVALTRIGPGGHFGELSLVAAGPRTADVVATIDSVLLVISRAEFFDLLQTDHTLAAKLLWRFLQNLGRRVKNLSSQVSRLVRERDTAKQASSSDREQDHGPTRR